jgi:hypothetical protein
LVGVRRCHTGRFVVDPPNLADRFVYYPARYPDSTWDLQANVDFVELNFSDLPLRNVLRIRNVSGAVAMSTSGPTVKVAIELIGGSDGAMLNLVPGESYSVPAAHRYPVNIPVNTTAIFYIDSRPIIRVFLASTVGQVIALFTVTGDLISTT